MKPKNAIAYVAFGSNTGSKRHILEKAIHILSRIECVRVTRVSSLFRTQPIGGPLQKDFLNGVLEISTSLSPIEVWNVLRGLEKRFGRRRRIRWGPRTLDLDLLTYENRCRGFRGLQIPHPRYHLRRFVLVPFCELAPRLRHPQFQIENRSLLRQLTVLGQRVTMVAQWKKSRFYRFEKRKKKKNPS